MYKVGYYSSISNRWVREHIKVWEEFMEVEVPFDDNGVRCHIHHLDGDKTNNDILNLVCMTDFDHRSYHSKNMSEESRKNISINNKGKHKNHKKFSEETKKKISENTKKAMQDPKIRKKMSESLKGRKMSEETKDKIRKTLLEKNKK
jgi:hypothetical protein